MANRPRTDERCSAFSRSRRSHRTLESCRKSSRPPGHDDKGRCGWLGLVAEVGAAPDQEAADAGAERCSAHAGRWSAGPAAWAVPKASVDATASPALPSWARIRGRSSLSPLVKRTFSKSAISPLAIGHGGPTASPTHRRKADRTGPSFCRRGLGDGSEALELRAFFVLGRQSGCKGSPPPRSERWRMVGRRPDAVSSKPDRPSGTLKYRSERARVCRRVKS